MATGILFFIIGNILAWFQYNSQFVWRWWADKPVLSSFIFAIPLGLCFWYAIRSIVSDVDNLWSSKLIGFGVSNVVFGVLTYFFLKESIFEPKTITCLFLSCAIIAIQVFWK
jgi:hypothetical protein